MITEKTTLKEIMEAGKEDVLKKHHVPCVSCPMSPFEIDKLEIGMVAKLYQLELQPILHDLNKQEGRLFFESLCTGLAGSRSV